ncbi:MAG: response regulator [Planctomycetes bacterium]|nr:response regulator [Planctomycetota bacterium]
MIAPASVHIIDDDPEFGRIVRQMLQPAGLKVTVHASAEEFLDNFAATADAPCCVLLDIHLPGISGLALLEKLHAQGVRLQVIVVSGGTDIATVVAAMKAGAADLWEKPLLPERLLHGVRLAIDRDTRQRCVVARSAHVRDRVAVLSGREKEVLELMVAGQSAKQMAAHLGITPKTAMKHRSRVLDKFGVENSVLLVQLLGSQSHRAVPLPPMHVSPAALLPTAICP